MTRLGIAAVLTVLSATATFGQVNGAIYTTVNNGTAVNQNIYAEKADVYLSGGPQNNQAAGLSPDGLYYFQVTDPSGELLLSTDPVACRVVTVAGGRVVGVPPNVACAHRLGVYDAANSTMPVQLMDYLDTPNRGGEYKAWLTPVDNYDEGRCDVDHKGSHGFCDNDSKIDNFKVRSSATAAFVTVCKFNDYDRNGIKDGVEPFIAHWPISATGVLGGEVASQTDDRGCTSFTVGGFTAENQTRDIVISEGSFGPDWAQTAPIGCGALTNCWIDGGKIKITVSVGDAVVAPAFGNANEFCLEGCNGGGVIATADAHPSFVKTFDWAITKSVDRSLITTASPSAAAVYTVGVSHDAGTDSGWKLTGEIMIANPGRPAISGMTVTAESTDAGTCEVNDAGMAAIASGDHLELIYHCSFPTAPASGSVLITAAWGGQTLTASAPYNFATAAVAQHNTQISVNDSMAGPLGIVNISMQNPFTFEPYSWSLHGRAGTCTTVNNTASFAGNGGATGSASQQVHVCVGADLTMSQTATASMVTGISKRVDRAVVQQQGGSATFNYTVTVTETDWQVTGTIHITNPNDWQPVTADLSETVPGASCNLLSAITVDPSSSVDVPYRCTFTAPPAISGSAKASLSWDAAQAYTINGSAQSSASYAFTPLTIVDAFNGAAAVTLGAVSTPTAVTNFAYPQTVANAAAGTCKAFANTATIAGTQQSASQTAYACNTLTGARTIGFWQNKNGQSLITGAGANGGVCKVTPWLRQFTAFQDLTVTSCSGAADFATKVIKAANASGASMNAMLKAQMLASALDVYFSDAALSGNTLAAPVSVGGVMVDLTCVCAAIAPGACNGTLDSSSAFGGSTSLTVMQMLVWQNGVSNVGGTVWYAQNKTTQGLAKNAFDAINNEVARIQQ